MAGAEHAKTRARKTCGLHLVNRDKGWVEVIFEVSRGAAVESNAVAAHPDCKPCGWRFVSDEHGGLVCRRERFDRRHRE
eukprot:4940696-Pleurochrysis_carterae.AAC.1